MEVCAFRDSMARLTDLHDQVVGVSVTPPFSNKGVSEKNYLPYPILSDYKREVIKNYGLELENFAGLQGYTVAKRSIFVLDQQVIIRYIWISENPTIEPDYKQIEEALSQIK
jgi:peroxiredoxin